MKKRTCAFFIFMLITMLLLVACNKSEEIICENCSAVITDESQYCPNCGTAFFQDSATATTEATDDNAENTASNDVVTESTQPTEKSPQKEEPTAKQPTQSISSNNSHTHNYSAATCTAPKTCSCGATKGSALGHSWSNATCTTPQKCSRCGTTTGSSSSHSYTSKVTAATCTSQGFTTYTCSACGHSYKDNYVSTSHNYQNYKCTSCGTVDKTHAYQYLVNWVKANGVTDGSYTSFSYQHNGNTFMLRYSAQYDVLAVDFIFSGGGGDFGFTSIYLDNYFYSAFVDDCEVTGYLQAATFNDNAAISCQEYVGPPDLKNTMVEYARTTCCATLEYLEWCLAYYEIGITVADLGFTSW